MGQVRDGSELTGSVIKQSDDRPGGLPGGGGTALDLYDTHDSDTQRWGGWAFIPGELIAQPG